MYMYPIKIKYVLEGSIDYNSNEKLPEIVKRELELLALKYGLTLKDSRMGIHGPTSGGPANDVQVAKALTQLPGAPTRLNNGNKTYGAGA